jgi:hypothetical protein
MQSAPETSVSANGRLGHRILAKPARLQPAKNEIGVEGEGNIFGRIREECPPEARPERVANCAEAKGAQFAPEARQPAKARPMPLRH